MRLLSTVIREFLTTRMICTNHPSCIKKVRLLFEEEVEPSYNGGTLKELGGGTETGVAYLILSLPVSKYATPLI